MEERASGSVIVNPSEGVELAAIDSLLAAWNAASAGVSGVDVFSSSSTAAFRLWQSRLLIKKTLLEQTAKKGVASKARTPIGGAWLKQRRLIESPPPWVLVGCPFTSNTSGSLRPDVGVSDVRRHLKSLSYCDAESWDWDQGTTVSLWSRWVDYGDLRYNPAVDSSDDIGRKLAFAVESAYRIGSRPLVIGGDHAISFYSISAALERHPSLKVVHLDAHSDRGMYEVNGAPIHAGNFISALRALAENLNILTIGVRGIETRSFATTRSANDVFITSKAVSKGLLQPTLDQFVSDGRPIYLTVDIDVIDPAYAPEVLYPVVSGLTPGECLAALDNLAGHEVIGADFVEVAGPTNTFNMAAANQARLIARIACS